MIELRLRHVGKLWIEICVKEVIYVFVFRIRRKGKRLKHVIVIITIVIIILIKRIFRDELLACPATALFL